MNETRRMLANTSVCGRKWARLTQFGACRWLRNAPTRQLPVHKSEKRLDCVIIGSPNAGKSVLLNCLINNRVAATSHKKHTTREEILGVYNYRTIQLAFYDTPGFVSKNDTKKLDSKTLQSIVKSSTSKADVVLIVVDSARSLTANFMHTFGEMVKIGLDCAKIEIILVLNKVDLIEPKTKLLEITRKLVSLINGIKLGPKGKNRAVLDTTTFMIDALSNDGVVDIKNYLLTLSKYKPWVIPKGGGVTNLSEEERIEQVVLEALLEHTHEEIPYIAEISCTSIKPNPKYVEIRINIYVDSVNQRRIVIGQQARTLVKVRTTAVEVLEDILKKNIILYLEVKLRGDDGDNVDDSEDSDLKDSGLVETQSK